MDRPVYTHTQVYIRDVAACRYLYNIYYYTFTYVYVLPSRELHIIDIV